MKEREKAQDTRQYFDLRNNITADAYKRFNVLNSRTVKEHALIS